jgi:hypothetical protein
MHGQQTIKKRVNGLVKFVNKNLMDIGVVVLALLLLTDMAKLMATFLNVINNVPNRNLTERRQNIRQRPENLMQSARCRQP